jgi:NAD(P)-dependent dehydrogenase (short-subunit alcohol dehydrogenase family)
VAGVLEGQVALVTGSGRGFGRAIARGLSAAGASVVVTARTAAEIEETARLIETDGGRAHAVVANLASRRDIEALRTAAEAELGPVSLLIHNAGVPWPFGPIWYVDPDRWWAAQEIHVRAAMYLIHTFVPDMVERRRGRVVIVSSTAGVRVATNLSGYGVAKSTQIRIAQYLGEAGREHGVAAFVIHPGSVLTGISDLTMADPDAQRYNAEFVERLTTRKAAGEDGSEALAACARLCVRLGSGAYDGLSGRYLTPSDDLDGLLADARPIDPAALGVVIAAS